MQQPRNGVGSVNCNWTHEKKRKMIENAQAAGFFATAAPIFVIHHSSKELFGRKIRSDDFNVHLMKSIYLSRKETQE